MVDDFLSKLDNPAWSALTGLQQQFSTGATHIKRYRRDILPFAAYEHGTTESISALDTWLEKDGLFYMIGELPKLPATWTIVKELPCAQMILRKPVQIAPSDDMAITDLTEAYREDMFNLIHKVQPGYYKPATHQLGNYCGIWQRGELAAIAGERMRMENLTEISAVCTDPAYAGRKYAQQLVAHLCNVNLELGNTPFLHVLQSNERAIGLYDYLGFTHRRSISFWQLKKCG